jgi:hypothetical protein
VVRGATEDHTLLAIQIESYEVSASASVNIGLRVFPPNFADEGPVLNYVTSLEVTGICTDPKECAGYLSTITIRVDEARASEKLLALKDMQVRDENHMPVYRNYHGNTYPVYKELPGIATLNNRRGEKCCFDVIMTI